MRVKQIKQTTASKLFFSEKGGYDRKEKEGERRRSREREEDGRRWKEKED